MQQVDMTFRKARVMRQLDFFYLSVGVLHELSQDLFPEKDSRGYRETVLVLDQQTDIPAPSNLPGNWPVAIVRAYGEVQLAPGIAGGSFHPVAVGINQDTVALAEDTAMDQMSLHSYCQHLAQGRKGLILKGGYLLIGESNQTSLVPMLGEPDAFTGIEYLLDQLPDGMLDAYYRRRVVEDYTKAAIGALHADMDRMQGKGADFHNWELANALIATACLSWIQFQKVDLNKTAVAPAAPVAEGLDTALAEVRESNIPLESPYGSSYKTTPEGSGIDVDLPQQAEHMQQLGEQILLPEESRSAEQSVLPGTLLRLRSSPVEASEEVLQEQAAFDELSPTEKAAKALGVAPSELEELQQFNEEAVATGAIKKTDVTLNLYEKLGAHLKRTSRIGQKVSKVSDIDFASLLAYLRNLLDYADLPGHLAALPAILETDFNELVFAVPDLASYEPQDVTDAFVLALIYLVDDKQLAAAALPPRYDTQGAFMPLIEPVVVETEEEALEIIRTAAIPAI